MTIKDRYICKPKQNNSSLNHILNESVAHLMLSTCSPVFSSIHLLIHFEPYPASPKGSVYLMERPNRTSMKTDPACSFGGHFQPLFVNEIIVYSLRFAFCQLFTTGCLYCEKGCIFFQLAAMTTAALDRNARLVSRYQMPFSFMEVKPVPGCHMDRADVMFPWEKTEGMS